MNRGFTKMKQFFYTLLFFLLLTPFATALNEIHYVSDSMTVTVTETDYTNPFLMQPSPQQPPSQPFDWIRRIYTLDRRLQKIEGPTGILLEVFYRSDLQIDYVKDYWYNIFVYYRYDAQNQLTALDYVDIATNTLLQTTHIAPTVYTGSNSYLQGSILEEHTYTMYDNSVNPPQATSLAVKDFFRLFLDSQQNVQPNQDFLIKEYYIVNAQGRVIDRQEYYINNQLVVTTYYFYNSDGFLQKVYILDHTINRVEQYHEYSYHSCPQKNIIKTVFIIDSNGGRFGDYVYDTPSPCNPAAVLIMIKDRATGQSLYNLNYYT